MRLLKLLGNDISDRSAGIVLGVYLEGTSNYCIRNECVALS